MKLETKDRLIVALDYKTLDEVKDIVNEIGDAVTTYKVGLELFLNTRGEAVDYLHSIDKKVFLDLKFHDIPNTTTMASMFAAKQEVFMFNVHASGGPTMMKKVAEMLKETNSDSIAIAVTILTSFSEEEVSLHFKSNLGISNLANHWAMETHEAGLHGVVCSPLEAKKIKEICGKDFYTVCPGVRPEWAAKNDQTRVMTPKMAIENGADFLVVGRPITKSENPVHAAKMILEEMA